MKSVLWWLLTVIVPLTQGNLPASVGQIESGAIRGRVIEEGTNLPIRDAEVWARSKINNNKAVARTDSAGDFLCPVIIPGPYALVCNARGYQQRVTAVPVSPATTSSVKVELERVKEDGVRRVPRIELISPTVDPSERLYTLEDKINISGRVNDKSPIALLLVQGTPVKVAEDGTFSTDISMKFGENIVTVTAINDPQSNPPQKWVKEELTIIRKDSSPTRADTVPTVSTLLKTRKYYALIIGNQNYRNLESLKTPIEDAQAISDVLKNAYGFETQPLLDASEDQIRLALSKYRKLRPDDSLLVYYAGHGHFDPEVQKAYWQPIDSAKDNNLRWISADDVTTAITAIRAGQILVISDSCYGGAIAKGPNSNLHPTGEREEFLMKMLDGRVRVLISSGSTEPVLDGRSKGHSLFAEALLKGLGEMRRDIFTAEEIFVGFVRYIRSNQTPQYRPIMDAGHVKGDFIFRRKRG